MMIKGAGHDNAPRSSAQNVLIGGDDFKSGQTKLKSVLVDFLVGAGLKPVSIVSYNHLGNNDGCNLSAPQVRKGCPHGWGARIEDMDGYTWDAIL